jgi:hypothetical protein
MLLDTSSPETFLEYTVLDPCPKKAEKKKKE